MKLNETSFIVGPRTRCCLSAFTDHFYPNVPEAEDGQPEPEEPNPDIQSGENFECPHCKNTILLGEDGNWVSLPADEVVDLTEPAPVVEAELTTPVSVV